MTTTPTSSLTALSALHNLFTAIAGKSESAELKNDLDLASTAVTLLVQTLVPRLDPKLDLTGLDAGLTQGFNGFASAVAAVRTAETTGDTTNG